MKADFLITEKRMCKDCKHIKQDFHGHFCSKLLMAITPNLRVTYHRGEKSCFEQKLNVNKSRSDSEGK